MSTLREIWILPIDSTINKLKPVGKLCLEVGNDEYMIVCNFGGRTMKGFEVIDGGRISEAPPGHRKQTKPSLNRVNS